MVVAEHPRGQGGQIALALLVFMMGVLAAGAILFTAGRQSNLRTDAQTAADAGALAGAAQLRDQLRVEAGRRLDEVLCGAGLAALDGFRPAAAPAVTAARTFAARNDAAVVGFAVSGRRVRVEAETRGPLAVRGGTAGASRATATATVAYRLLVTSPVPGCEPPPAGGVAVPLPRLDDALAFQVRLVD